MKKLKSTFPNMILSLTLICLVSAGLLGYTYTITLVPICTAQLAKQEEAIRSVQPEFDEIKEIDTKDASVYQTFKDGKQVGSAVKATSQGFSGEQIIMVGYDINLNIIDYSVIQQTETPGLGTKIVFWFKEALKGRNLANTTLTVSKDGGDVDAITAATISSRAFLRAINKSYTIVSKINE